ncbi:MAG TPA: phytanoyl-CoA dioxygenase family protein [Pyrinomonadaceae bacterium]
MQPATMRAIFRAQGFVLLRSVFERSLMDELRVALDHARVAEEQRFGLEALREIGQDGYISDLLGIGPPIEKLLDSDPVHEVLANIFGEEAALYVGQGIILDPGKGRGVWPRCWHADMFEARCALADPEFCFGINCLIVVDDINEENGPTAVLPGSHNLKTMRANGEDDLKQMEFRAVAPSGSLLILDGGVWHSASINHSSAPRRVVKLLFTRRWIRSQIDYAAIRDNAEITLSPRVRRLLRMPALAMEIGGNG